MENRVYSVREMLSIIIEEDFSGIKKDDICFDFSNISSAVYSALKKVLKKSNCNNTKNKKGKDIYEIDDRGKELIRVLFYSATNFIYCKSIPEVIEKNCFYIVKDEHKGALVKSYIAKVQYKAFIKWGYFEYENYFIDIFAVSARNFIISWKEILESKKVNSDFSTNKKILSNNITLPNNIKNNEVNQENEVYTRDRYNRVLLLEFLNGDVHKNVYNYYKLLKRAINFDELIVNSNLLNEYTNLDNETKSNFINSICISYINEFLNFYNSCKFDINLIKALESIIENFNEFCFCSIPISIEKPSRLPKKQQLVLLYNTFIIFNERYFDCIIENFVESVDPILYEKLTRIMKNKP